MAISANQTTVLATDLDSDGFFDPLDTVTTTVVISNSAGPDATSVALNETLDGMTLVNQGADGNTLNDINVSPLAFNDSYNAVGNTPLVISAADGVLQMAVAGVHETNSADMEFRGATIGTGANDTKVVAGTFATAQLGSVTIAADGSFTYTPKTGFSGTGAGADTFTYTLRDAGLDGVFNNTDDLTGTGTVSIDVGPVVWYIDKSASAVGMDGSKDHPFNSIAAFNNANGDGAGFPAAGDIVFLRHGGGTGIYSETDGINLLNGQQLIGEGQDLQITPTGGGNPVLIYDGNASLTPTIQVTGAGQGVALAQNNSITGLDIGSTNAASVGIEDGGGTVGTLNITDVSISGTGKAVDIDQGGTLAVTIESLGSTGSTTEAVDLQGLAGTFNAGGGTISGAAATTFNVSGGTLGGTISSNITQANNAAMVSVAGGHGTGTLTFQTGTLSATNGSGLQFNNADGTYNFSGTASLNGVSEGIGILSGSAGTFSFGANTSITNSTGVSYNEQTSTANVTYAGAISDSANSNIGINFNTKTGGTTVFSGDIDLSGSSAGNGLVGVINGTSAGEVRFTGDLDLVGTGSTTGFQATSNTITVQGTGNTISTATGVALLVNGATISANDLTFQSISANGAAHGIELNNTGTSGGLNVTGDGTTTAGGNGSGGTILNATGDAIVLNGTMDVTLQNMAITGPAGHGINADNLTGVNLFQSLSISGFDTTNKDGITVDQTANFTSVTLDRSHIFDTGDHGGNDAFRFVALSGSSASGTVNVTASEFDGLDGDGIQINNDGSGTINTTITGNNLHTADTFGGGNFNTLSVNLTGNGVLNATIGGAGALGNTLNDVARVAANAGALSVAVAGPAALGGSDLNATIENNTITDIPNRRGINVQLEASAANHTLGHDITIKDNNIQNTVNRQGIYVSVVGAAGFDNQNNDITITGNLVGTVTPVGNAARPGIHIQVFDDFATAGTALETDILLQNNQVRVNNTGDVVRIETGAGLAGNTANVEATVLGNTFTNDNAGGTGFNAEVGFFVDGLNTFSLDLNSANVGANSNTSNRGYVLNHDKTNPAAVFNVEVHAADAVVNTAGATYTDAQIETFFTARNTGAITTPANNNDFKGVSSATLPLLASDGGIEPSAHTDPVMDVNGPSDVVPPLVPSDPAPPSPDPSPVPADDGILSGAELALTVAAALDRWANAGLSAEQLEALDGLTFGVADMSGWHLGSFAPGAITLDADAAGYGWFVDATPLDDGEFGSALSATRLQTTPAGAPAGHFDLLTTVMHEMGHALGLEDSYATGARDGLMYGYLVVGERRLPGEGEADGAVAGSITSEEFLGAPVTIGTLPGDKSVTVQWQATITGQTNQLIDNPVNTGTVTHNLGSTNTNTVTTALDSLSLGSLVFNDINQDGDFDAGTDAGIDSVALTLFADTGAAPGAFDGTDAQLATTTTAGGGIYSFTGIAPGDYIVRVDQSNFNVGNPLAGLLAVPGGTDPDDNLENDDNGQAHAGAGVVSLPITLAYNTEPTPGTGNDDNTTLDFGFEPDDPAVAIDDAFTTNELTAIGAGLNVFNANPTTADSDPDTGFSVIEVNGVPGDVGNPITLPSGALLTLNSTGTFSYNPNGAFQATPAPFATSGASNTPATDTFTYTVSGGDTATVTVTITGIDNNDLLLGTAGADTLRAGAGTDQVQGLGGDDDLYLSAGQVFSGETYDGGADTDAIYVEGVVDATGVDFIAIEALEFGAAVASSIVLDADEIGAGLSSTLAVEGDGDPNAITINMAAPGTLDVQLFTFTLWTPGLTVGVDDTFTINGSSGNDVIRGPTVDATFNGDVGDDFFIVHHTDSVVNETAGEGANDRVFTSVNYALTAGSEIEILSTDDHAGTGAIDLTGNGLNNLIYGNAGDNRLDGLGGNDTLVGFGGDDEFVVDSSLDIVSESAGAGPFAGGADHVFASVSYRLRAGSSVERLSTTDAAANTAINLTGNDLVNLITGNAGANWLDGGGGADTLTGLAGNDFYFVDNAADTVVEAAGDANDRVFASTTYSLGAGVSVETLSTTNHAGGGAINLSGNELANFVAGNAGSNTLNGGAGKDILAGFGGSDSFLFDTALNTAPTANYAGLAATANVDRITDFDVANDLIHLEDTIFAAIGSTLDAGEFTTGAAASTASHRIIYNNTTGQLTYDADGSNAGAAFQFALLAPSLALSNTDFVVV